MQQLTRLSARESFLTRCKIHGDGNLPGGEYLCQNLQQFGKRVGIHIEDEGFSIFAKSGKILCETTAGRGKMSFKDDCVTGKARDRYCCGHGRGTRNDHDRDSCLMGSSHK